MPKDRQSKTCTEPCRIRKWLGFSVIAFVLVVTGAVAQAQQPAEIAKIGWLAARPASVQAGGTELFRVELGRLGYVEGKQVAFEYRYAKNEIHRLPALANELVRLGVDVLIASRTLRQPPLKMLPEPFPSFLQTWPDPDRSSDC